ncbi:MAG: hypothetical protein A2X31_00410 [Elusimicrobia bacterium GWB2_63_22]|nr:MAG: hypothetical protein A2X31_00410 [Elusimicrobia bacterium GWB2_63_22]
MTNGIPPHDFEDILKETELDSAKMILRLTSELHDKELEVASTRSRSFEEIQRNNKAKEAEFEALMRAQEERIAKREQELARLLVEKESALWQKYQAMLDDAVSRQRADFESERELLKADIDKKETELAAQKKNLRLEMEALFKKWEAEREADFKNERETFIEELKLGRETAKKDALERARQMEELWRQKLLQQEADYQNREAISAEEIRSHMRRERVEELRELNDRLNSEFSKREQELYAHYAAWLEENKKLIEDKHARRAEAVEAEHRERTARLEDSLAKTRQELDAREKTWEEKYAELRRAYAEKEAALEAHGRGLEAQHLTRDRELSDKYEELARALREDAARRKDALLNKEKSLEAQYAANLADFAAESERRLKSIEAREAKAGAERGELAALRAQIGSLLAQKQQELEKTFAERNSLAMQSLEESYKIKEASLAKKYEDIDRHYASLAAQKDEALARAAAAQQENARLKDALSALDSDARGAAEAERARLAAERDRLEAEFSAKTEKFKAEAAERERAVKAAYAEKLEAESARLGAQLRIKEEALAKEREELDRRSAETQERFMQALKEREGEISGNFLRHSESLKTQAEAARRAWEEERAALAAAADAETGKVRELEREAAARREAELKAFYEAREKEYRASADQAALAAERHLAENFAIKEQSVAGRVKALEESLAKLSGESETTARELATAKNELELFSTRLEEAAREKQKLIQENLTKARDLRQTLEKEFLDKLKDIEQNYLGQLTDLSKRSEEVRRADQDEYFRKLQFVKDDFNAQLAEQAKAMEAAYLEREKNLSAAMEQSFKLKERALGARQAQLENSYQAMLSEKSSLIDTDRELAESVGRMKDELEAKNSELKETINSYNTRLAELEARLRSDFEARRKDLEDTQRMRASQLEAERTKLKAVLDQEQQLVTDLQKREAALQEGYAAREAELARRFKEARERLEKDYQDKLKEQGGNR